MQFNSHEANAGRIEDNRFSNLGAYMLKVGNCTAPKLSTCHPFRLIK